MLWSRTSTSAPKSDPRSPLDIYGADIDSYIRDFLLGKGLSETNIWRGVVLARRLIRDRHEARQRGEEVEERSIFQLGEMVFTRLYDAMGPAERYAVDLANMSDRALLEAIYRKLYPAP